MANTVPILPVRWVVARRAAHEDPKLVEPPEEHESQQQRRQQPEADNRDGKAARAGLVLKLRADPHPRRGDRPPERERDEHHEREE